MRPKVCVELLKYLVPRSLTFRQSACDGVSAHVESRARGTPDIIAVTGNSLVDLLLRRLVVVIDDKTAPLVTRAASAIYVIEVAVKPCSANAVAAAASDAARVCSAYLRGSASGARHRGNRLRGRRTPTRHRRGVPARAAPAGGVLVVLVARASATVWHVRRGSRPGHRPLRAVGVGTATPQVSRCRGWRRSRTNAHRPGAGEVPPRS